MSLRSDLAKQMIQMFSKQGIRSKASQLVSMLVKLRRSLTWFRVFTANKSYQQFKMRLC